jgi:hypothetical protein
MTREEDRMDRFNLGAYGRPISTRSAETQRWFDIGLNWCYGFNHEEGIKCFERALESDPGCPMAHWGIAYAAGPFYNLTWKEHGEAEADSATKRCFEHVQLARANAARASPVERGLIEALARRFQQPHRVTPQEFEQWDDAYAAKMRQVYVGFPDDRAAPLGPRDGRAGPEFGRHRGAAGMRAVNQALGRGRRRAASGDPPPAHPSLGNV